MRKAIMAAVDSASIFSSDHPNPYNQPPPLTNEARASQPSSSNLRYPLQSRDRNVKMRVQPPPKAPLATKSANRKMVHNDKQHITSRPLAANFSAPPKASNSKPLTPRVAGSILQAKTSVLPQQAALSPAVGAKSRDNTPMPSLLTCNITPRSGSRKSRIDSAGSTPTSTPIATPDLQYSSDMNWHAQSTYGTGSGNMKGDRIMARKQTLSARPPLDLGSTKFPLGVERDAKFFFADEVRTATSQPRPQVPKKGSSTFFYANGDVIPSPPQHSAMAAIGSTVAEDKSNSKFFHANCSPDLSFSADHLPSPRPGSELSFSSRMSNTRTGNQSSSKSIAPGQARPLSPPMVNQHSTTPILIPSPIPSEIHHRLQLNMRVPPANIIEPQKANAAMRTSMSAHGRSSSCDTARFTLPFPQKIYSENSIDSNINLPRIPTASKTSSENVIETESICEPQSPIKIGNSLEHLNELASNARTERKVLDLEITNSSLAAINRTLEREMRKQSAELRRYRRLSRSGRLSIATNASIHGTPLSNMSEDDGEETDAADDHEEISEDTSEDDSLSPDVPENDLRHRTKDVRMLQQDLAKHRQLLVDSQKMNQTLKRCLGLTEELIGQGKKALQYKVAATDVELGGRVLGPDESHEDDNEGMSEVGLQMLKEARLAALNERSSWTGNSKLDQDTGIDIVPPACQHNEAAGQPPP